MIPFAKWQGCGNDFVLLLESDLKTGGFSQGLTPDQIRCLCHRRFGIGSDGLILLSREERGLVCRMWNPDGSSSGMCGNGIRCAALFAAGQGLWTEGIPFWMADRLVGVSVMGGSVTLGMGQASGDPWNPARTDLPPQEFSLVMGEKRLAAHGVSFGNPHLVVIVSELDEVPLAEWGPGVERHPDLPGSVNVHFVQPLNQAHARALHWERGAGPTLGCGSGSCAIFTVLRQAGLCGSELSLQLPGGLLSLSQEDQGVCKKGPASECFTGWVEIS